MSNIHFSIITSTLNAGKEIGKCLSSVSSQDYTLFEHLVVDGKSSDNTLQIISSHQPRKNLQLVCSSPDRGIYDAWNRGVDVARGDWLLFLGADDTLYDTSVLSRVSHCLERLSETADYVDPLFLFGITQFSDGTEEKILDYQLSPFDFRLGKTRFPTAVFISRRLFQLGHRFDPSYRICGDHKFFLCHDFYSNSLLLDIRVLCFSMGGVSSSKRYEWLHFKERCRMLNETGNPRSFHIDVSLALKALISLAIHHLLVVIFDRYKRKYPSWRQR